MFPLAACSWGGCFNPCLPVPSSAHPGCLGQGSSQNLRVPVLPGAGEAGPGGDFVLQPWGTGAVLVGRGQRIPGAQTGGRSTVEGAMEPSSLFPTNERGGKGVARGQPHAPVPSLSSAPPRRRSPELGGGWRRLRAAGAEPGSRQGRGGTREALPLPGGTFFPGHPRHKASVRRAGGRARPLHPAPARACRPPASRPRPPPLL